MGLSAAGGGREVIREILHGSRLDENPVLRYFVKRELASFLHR